MMAIEIKAKIGSNCNVPKADDEIIMIHGKQQLISNSVQVGELIIFSQIGKKEKLNTSKGVVQQQ